MRIGLANFLNSQPLTYGFLQQQGHDIRQETPATLIDLLLRGRLETALISSVGCLQNRERLGWCSSVGVCAAQRAYSIVYIRKRDQRSSDPACRGDAFPAPIRQLYADQGSRSSIALFLCLYYAHYQQLPPVILIAPGSLPEQLSDEDGGLLIGDAALRFLSSRQRVRFQIRDLGELWYQRERLPFVFALWAYPRSYPLPDQLFVDSYRQGRQALDHIIRSSPFPEARSYLTEFLHYEMGPEEQQALQRFEEYIRATPLRSLSPASPDPL